MENGGNYERNINRRKNIYKVSENYAGLGFIKLSPYLETKLKGLTKDEVYDMSIDILYGYAKDAQLIVNPVEENNYDYQY